MCQSRLPAFALFSRARGELDAITCALGGRPLYFLGPTRDARVAC